jgi:hypothetical protein
MPNSMLKDIVGGLLILTSLLDAIKYYWAAQKIKEFKSAKGASRKFLNAAIANDLAKLIYSILILDIFIFIASISALMTMCYNYYIVYKFYPYKYRGLQNFRKPNILLYIWNSLTPNSIRKRL